MIRTETRTASKPHVCGSCLAGIRVGDTYLEHVASPNHDYLGNTRWWRSPECGDCARRYGRGHLLDTPIVLPGRCDECGRFVKASELILVYGPMVDDGPDHEACIACRAKRRRALAETYGVVGFPERAA